MSHNKVPGLQGHCFVQVILAVPGHHHCLLLLHGLHQYGHRILDLGRHSARARGLGGVWGQFHPQQVMGELQIPPQEYPVRGNPCGGVDRLIVDREGRPHGGPPAALPIHSLGPAHGPQGPVYPLHRVGLMVVDGNPLDLYPQVPEQAPGGPGGELLPLVKDHLFWRTAGSLHPVVQERPRHCVCLLVGDGDGHGVPAEHIHTGE